MTTPVGQIGLSDVNAELGLSPSALITMNDANVRTLAGVGGSGTIISMNDLRGKSNRVALNLTISGSTYNYDVYSAASANPAYNAGKTDLTLTINPGVFVGSNTTGAYALSVPSSFNPGDTVTIVNNGTVIGKGGSGAPGGNTHNGNPGSIGSAQSGGAAAYVNRPTTITNNGTFAGGGGGGGAGRAVDTYYVYSPESSQVGFTSGGGGGGGAGYSGGSGGSGGVTNPAGGVFLQGAAGNPGNANAGGSGGVPAGSNIQYRGPAGLGGAGGGQGAAGSPGLNNQGPIFALLNPAPTPGAPAGAYLVGSPYVSWPATGTRLGPVS